MSGRVRRGVRLFALALLPVALVLSHRNTTVVVALIAATGIAALPRLRWEAWTWPFLLLAGYLALSAAWSPSTEDADWALRIPVLVVAIAALVAAGRRSEGQGRWFGLTVLAACLLLGIEGVTGGGVRDVLPPPNAADRDDVATARGIGLALVIVPAGAACLVAAFGRVGVIMSLIATACLLIGCLRFDIAANSVALLTALAGIGLAAAAPRHGLAILLTALGAAFLIVPAAASLLPPEAVLLDLEAGPVSWRQRLLIWRTVADAALSDPLHLLFGAGQHGSEALGEQAGTVMLSGAPVPLPRVPSHPHNVFLQVWYEAGLIGSLLAATGFGLAAARVASTTLDPVVRVAAGGTLGAVLLFWTVDANLWTLWRAAALVLAAYGLQLAASDRTRVVYQNFAR